MKKINALATLLITLLTFHANAGSWSSGGGNAVVCRDNTGAISSAELLDLYEWRTLENIQPLPASGDHLSRAVSASFQIATGLWQGVPGVGNDPALVDKVKVLNSSMRLINSGLLPSQDSFHFIVPKDCNIEPLARYQLPTDQLYIDKEIWLALDETNKAALLVHEALYTLMRIYGEQDSIRVRKAVAKGFAGYEFKNYLENVIGKEVEYCSTTDRDGPLLPWISFVTYPNTDGSVQIQFLTLAGLQMIAKASGTAPTNHWPISESHHDTLYIMTIEGVVDGDRKLILTFDPQHNGLGRVDLFNGVANPPKTKLVCQKTKFEI